MSDKKVESAEQIARFRDTAKAIGCDEDKERFEKALGEIARHKPSKDRGKKRTRVKNAQL
jgi:hypothetical protein